MNTPHPSSFNGIEDGTPCSPMKLKTVWFSFGQSHAHALNGMMFDKDTVVQITAVNPRQVMFDTFGNKWSMQYNDQPPDMRHFPKGIFNLDGTQSTYGMSDWQRAAMGLKDRP